MAFERIGEDVSEAVERGLASFVVLRMVRPKYVPKGRSPEAEATQNELGSSVSQAPPPEQPIPCSIAGPGLLAETIVRRFQDHLPLHRLEGIYEREGLPLAKSTICGWHREVAQLVVPLLVAMWQDAMGSPYLCTDAIGVLVRALHKCRRAHFFVVIAPEKHVLFGYSPKHNAKAVDKLLGGYKGYLVADAHAVYNHLYTDGEVVEVEVRMSKETRMKAEAKEKCQASAGGAPIAQGASGAPLSAVPVAGPLGPRQRWSLARRRDVSLRLLRGESVEALSRELGVEAYRLEEWHRRAIAGIDASLRVRATSADEVELGVAMKRVGELTMQNELLRHRLGDAKLPLGARRSK